MTTTETSTAAHATAKSIRDGLAVPDDSLTNIEFLAALRGEIEDLIAGQVAVARTNRETWAQIADSLGMESKQAAQWRYGR